ncbi:MAG: XTP/dITP diphosphatase [Bacillota bacterium]
MNKLFLATGNRGKIKEFKKLLADLDVEIKTTFDYNNVPEVIEDGQTLRANALKKARQLAEFSKMLTIADDTGLLVDALDGKPGVYSARYAGEDVTYEENNKKLLQELSGVEAEGRTARFKTVIALVSPQGKEEVVTGCCEGVISSKLRGERGFGYDPLFIPEGYDRTFAELSAETKNQISHRAKALTKLKKVLSRDWVS